MTDTPTEIPELDPSEARRRVDAGAAFVDVREPDELRAVRVPDAASLPLSTFLDAWEATLDPKREVMVLCRSGARSGRVTAFLREQGVPAVNVRGGILAWERDGLTVEKD